MMTAQRVTNWENAEAHNLALACDAVFDHAVNRITELRERQKSYLANLPSDPRDAILAALRALDKDINRPAGFQTALMLSRTLRPMLERLEMTSDHDHEALLWVADRIESSLWESEKCLQLIEDILRNAREGAKQC